MQNWILDFDFYKSASYLDRHRLQANIYENIHGLASIYNLNTYLINPKKNVKNHRNIKRWIGAEQAYFNYIDAHLYEWDRRYKITQDSINYNNFIMLCKKTNIYPFLEKLIPRWINDDLIKQHRQILLNKNYEHYSKYFIKER